MMIRFSDALSAKDREHLRKILNASLSTTKSGLRAMSSVGEFLRDDTYIDDGALQAWKELAQPERERLISELIWRVTCHLDGSITRVLGVNTYPLGRKFSAVQSEQEGRDIFCLAVAS